MSGIICLKCLHTWEYEGGSGKPQCPNTKCLSRLTAKKEKVDEALEVIREREMEEIELPDSVFNVLTEADSRFPVGISILNNLIELAEEAEDD